MGDIWIHSKDDMTIIHIPEIKELANAMNKIANEMNKIANEMNKIANELAKANNTNSGKHMADYVEKFEEE